VESDSNAWVTYRGAPLEALQQAWWQVRVREDDGNVTGWSEPAMFELGLFGFDDWRGAEWIQAPDYEADT
jgi:alpha-L-rhamnosidase